MRRKLVMTCIALIALMVAGAFEMRIARSQVQGKLRIGAIRAMPYYAESGVIRQSTDLLDRRLALRNIVMAPSSSGDPLRRPRIEDWDVVFGTTATMVDVEVVGLDAKYENVNTRILLLVTEASSGRVLTKQSVELSSIIVSDARQIHVPFFVYGTGCEPVALKVTIRAGTTDVEHMERTIPFECGE